MKPRGRFWRWLIPVAAAAYIKLLRYTQRLSFQTPDYISQIADEGSACIALLWHNRIIVGSAVGVGRNLAVIISRSRDGDFIADTVERIGYTPVRGSSSRGQLQSVRDILDRLQDGQSVVMTPDGPRGPCYEMQAGPIEVARLSGLPIVATGLAPYWAKRVGSWDRLILPCPFTRVAMVMSEPIFVSDDINREERERLRVHMETVLRDINRQAEELAGWPEDPALSAEAARQSPSDTDPEPRNA